VLVSPLYYKPSVNDNDTYGRTDIVDKKNIERERERERNTHRGTPARHILAPALPPHTNKPMYGRLQENHTPLPPGLTYGDNQNQQSHSAEGGGNAENKTILLTNGIVANWCLLLNDTKTTQPTPQGSNPSAFQYRVPAGTHRSIDRERRRSCQSQKWTYRPSIGK